MNTGILIAVLIYEIGIILGVGLWIARREAKHPKREGDFALAGRDLPVPVVAITLALTVLGTSAYSRRIRNGMGVWRCSRVV